MPPFDVKICFKCGASKSPSDFYKHPEMSDGRLGKCKQCCRDYGNAHRLLPEIKEKIKAYKKEYEQRPEVRESHKRYDKLHPEINRARRKRWKDRNPEKMRVKVITDNAIRTGLLIKQSCEICGKTYRIEAHHKDYTKPLEVVWLCKKHHWQADEERRAIERAAIDLSLNETTQLSGAAIRLDAES